MKKIILLLLLTLQGHSTSKQCEEATLLATKIYVEFMDGKRSWESTRKYDRTMKRVCK